MRYWLHIHDTPPEQILDLARFAEELGFEGMLDGDHWFMPVAADGGDHNEQAPLHQDAFFADHFVVGGMVAAVTKRIKFGPCVLVLPNRSNPFLVAKAASTVARMGGHRFVLGVGVGWTRDEFAAAGLDFETRAARFEEMIAVLRKLWRPGPVEHHGRFFDFPATYAEPTPGRDIPIYIGATAPAALRRAGRLGDGWMGMQTKLSDMPRQIAHINEGRRAAGRDREPFDFMVGPLPEDGAAPHIDDWKRMEQLGITSGMFGPINWVVGERRASLDAKKRLIETFMSQVRR